MSLFDWVGWVMGGLPLLVFTVYVLIRVGAAGFFKSKQQFDYRSRDAKK